MAQSGVTIAELMALLGHASADVATRYQHVAADRAAHSVTKLAELIQIPQLSDPAEEEGNRR